MWRTVIYVHALEAAKHSPGSLSHSVSVVRGIFATVACAGYWHVLCRPFDFEVQLFLSQEPNAKPGLCRFSHVSMSIHALEKVQQTAGGVSIHTHRIASPMSCEATVSWKGLESCIFYSTMKLLAAVVDSVPQLPAVDILHRRFRKISWSGCLCCTCALLCA